MKNASPQKPKTELPEPMELATLAAILAPNEDPAAALERAMEFYTEAVLLSQELPASLDELIKRFGNEKRRLAVMAQHLEDFKLEAVTLELDPSKNDDEVRGFLSKNGLGIKGAGKVIVRLKSYLDARPTDTFLAEPRPSTAEIIEGFKRKRDGRMIYAINKDLLVRVIADAKFRSSQSKKKGHETRKASQAPQFPAQQPSASPVK